MIHRTVIHGLFRLIIRFGRTLFRREVPHRTMIDLGLSLPAMLGMVAVRTVRTVILRGDRSGERQCNQGRACNPA